MGKKNKEDIRILLMQIREHAAVKDEELHCFVKYSGLKKHQFTILDVFKDPSFDTKMIDNFDALFVGGASSANVLLDDTFPFLQNSRDLLSYCINKKIPVFASCFGFQLAVQSLNGEIIHQENDFEMGTVPIKISPKGREDILLNDVPDNFYGVSVHQQKAIVAPPNTEVLAYTDECIHVIKVVDCPFWAFQFHPEVDLSVLTHRLGVYSDKYTKDSEHFENIIKNACETPESNLLLIKFVNRVLVQLE